MSKTRVVEMLGEKSLVLPALLNAAILANERAKYVLALLQVAAGNAENPSAEAPSLRAEREACGIAEGRLDRIVPRSEALGPGVYHIPEAAHLITILSASLETMLAPLALAGGGFSEETSASTKMVERKKRLLDAIPPIEGDIVSGETIAALTSGRPAAGDGIHVLVMDLHKEINRLQALIAEEEIAGARAYDITAADRPLIEAFMAGVRQTAARALGAQRRPERPRRERQRLPGDRPRHRRSRRSAERSQSRRSAGRSPGSTSPLRRPLAGLADLVLEGAQSLRRAMAAAPEVHRGGSREPMRNFLEAADRLVTVEHQTDARERDVTVDLMAAPIDSRQLHLFGEIARHLEEAADSMLRAGLMLRDHIMGNVMFE